jgi:hypothetical protein
LLQSRSLRGAFATKQSPNGQKLIASAQTTGFAMTVGGMSLIVLDLMLPRLDGLAAALEVAGELERIGDCAEGIARINVMIGGQPLVKPLIDLPLMAHKVRQMLHAALVAFVQRDLKLARSIPKLDDEIDRYVPPDPPRTPDAERGRHRRRPTGNQLLCATHKLDGAADRVTNLCNETLHRELDREVKNMENQSG